MQRAGKLPHATTTQTWAAMIMQFIAKSQHTKKQIRRNSQWRIDQLPDSFIPTKNWEAHAYQEIQ